MQSIFLFESGKSGQFVNISYTLGVMKPQRTFNNLG